ncbi:MAG: hypothetical protein J5J06_01665 [Phycisphaerae bacterium]|nr:hypothetical protein [Phycisphaerae bacterium]
MSGKIRVIGGIVLAVAVALLLVWWLSKPSTGLPSRFEFVCVETGKVYNLTRAEAAGVLPLKNPDTGRRSLFPLTVRDGKQFIDQRYRDSLEQMKDENKFFDTTTMARKQ